MKRDDTRTATGHRFVSDQRDKIEARKAKHARLCAEAREKCAWVISVAGDPVIRFDCLPDSPFPADLRERGFDLIDEGEGSRILHAAITERFVRGADGELVLATEGSTRPIAESRTHAGIVKVKRCAFEMP
jgi:hypothetical protein